MSAQGPDKKRGRTPFACRRIRPWISACLDGEASPKLRSRVEAHLARCPLCRIVRLLLAASRARLRSMGPAADPPPDLADAIRSALYEAEPRRRGEILFRSRRIAVISWAAGGLLIAAAGFFGLLMRVDPIVRLTAESHRAVFAGKLRPLIVSNRLERIGAMLYGRTGSPVLLPTSVPEGTKPVFGHAEEINGLPVVHVAFKIGASDYLCFCTHPPIKKELQRIRGMTGRRLSSGRRVYCARCAGLEIVFWDEREDVQMAAVSTLPEAALLSLVDKATFLEFKMHLASVR